MKLLSREEIIEKINQILDADKRYPEKESDDLLDELKNGVIDPNISDYIYYDELTPEQIADKALSYKPIYL